MKSILVHADDTAAMTTRLESALTLARLRGGHVTLLVNTPFYRFVAMDPFGGAYLAAGALAEAQARDAVLAARLEAELANEDVSWDVVHGDGDLITALASAAALADLSIVTMTSAMPDRFDGAPLLGGDLALASRAPVLALPEEGGLFDLAGPALVAWNGSAEAATALRAAVPLLAGRDVTLLRIGAQQGQFPDTAAAKYLARHGVRAELREQAASSLSTGQDLEAAAFDMGAALLVMGAFGRGRLRETLFGGVTRHLLNAARVPLLLAH